MNVCVIKEAVGAKCDQWCRIDKIEGGNLHVTLLGTGEKAIVAANELCGIELDDSLSLLFVPKSTKRIRVHNGS